MERREWVDAFVVLFLPPLLRGVHLRTVCRTRSTATRSKSKRAKKVKGDTSEGRLLEQLDEPFPKSFVLQDVVDRAAPQP